MHSERMICLPKLQLNSGETLIGTGNMALQERIGIGFRNWQGHIYITNQRVIFRIYMSSASEIDLPLSQISGFSAMRVLFIPGVTIHSKSGKRFVLTGFPAKKVQGWLRQVGISKL